MLRRPIPADEMFVDDKPVFSWERFQGMPARSWRFPDPPKLTRAEVCKAGILGLAVSVVVFGCLIVALIAL